jgi:hypothetical protein
MPRLLRLADVRATAADAMPPGYRLAMRGTLDLDRDRGRLGGLSLLALAVALPLFVLLSAPLGGLETFADGLDLLELALVLLAAIVVLPIVHEAIHGAAATLVGGRPVYGLALPVAAFCHITRPVSRGQYALITAAPLVVITLAGLLLMPLAPVWLRLPLLALMTTNAAGAVGDLWLLIRLRGAPPAALIADIATGFEAYTRTTD